MLMDATYSIKPESFYGPGNFKGADSFYIPCRNGSEGSESGNEMLFPGLEQKMNC